MTRPLRFGVIADCQYEPIEDETLAEIDHRRTQYKVHRLTQAKLREAVATFNRQDLDFVVHLGDFTQNGLQHAAILSKEIDQLHAPFHHVLGNHDFDRAHTDEVLAAYAMPQAYYSWQVGDVRCIVLDTNDGATYRYDDGTDEYDRAVKILAGYEALSGQNAYPWNGWIDTDQLTWLDDELSKAALNGQRAVLFSHHPVYPMSTLTLLNAPAVLEIIDQHEDTVAAYINGHNHFGSAGIRHGIPYITVPAMLQGETNAYGIVGVEQGRVRVEGYGRLIDMEFE